ncbi:uncharacterized protein LOC114722677 isoform X2 [Neltuma alba]|uniref:uncharacterized protein LOC114722677 isoform X2 n=1 Tax=Neltuma alba TaxID=207710 RepID=UPI0010A2C6A5|nr:uncharacterized protein LOC114722677 isoform X2 [Prosopis alba]
MDPFDDVLPEAPVSRGRVGGKFVPKAKAKQLARKEISTSNQANSSNDGKNEQVASSSMSSDTVGNVPTKSNNPVDLTPDKSAKEFLKSSLGSPIETPFLDNNNNPDPEFQQIDVSGREAEPVEAQPSTIAASEVNSDWTTNFPKAANEADLVSFDVGLVVAAVPGSDLHDAQPDLLTNVIDPSTANSTIIENEPSKYWEGEGPFLDGSKSLEPTDSSLQAGPNVESRGASDCKVAMLEPSHSNSNLERTGEVESSEFELDPFRDTLPDPGLRNARKFQPKIKPRPRAGTTAVVASASSNDILRTINTLSDADNSCSSVPLSEDKRSLGTVIPSQSEPPPALLSEVSVHHGPKDWPSNSGKPAGEATDIFSVLESLDDFLTHDGSSAGNPALHSFHEEGTEDFVNQPCHISQAQKCPDYKATHDSLAFKEAASLSEGDSHTNNGGLGAEDAGGSNPTHPLDDTLDYSSMNSGSDPTFEIPVREEPPEEPTNTANNPTYDDLLHVDDVPGEKDGGYKAEDATMSSSAKNIMKSSVVGEKGKVDKPRRQVRKRVNLKTVDPVENEDPEEEDELDPTYSNIGELEEQHDEYELNNGCVKKKKKSVTKNAKPHQKRKRANEDLDKATKEPRKKFSHSTQRRKRCVDKTLLEIPEDELDPQTLRIKDIILLAEYRERQAKKEAMASKTSSINGRDGDSLHNAAARDEDMGSEYGRGSDDDQATESVPLAPTLFNYQSFMDKKPRGKWSKQDTELFYEAIRQFGTDFSMIQQLFPDRTRHQIKLKYKQEERQHPLLLSDAVNNRTKDLSHYKSVFERLQRASAKTEQDTTDASVGMTEEVVDLTSDPNPNPNEAKDAKPEQDGSVQDHQEDNVSYHSAEKSDEMMMMKNSKECVNIKANISVMRSFLN